METISVESKQKYLQCKYSVTFNNKYVQFLSQHQIMGYDIFVNHITAKKKKNITVNFTCWLNANIMPQRDITP
jgi:hypothetical protein